MLPIIALLSALDNRGQGLREIAFGTTNPLHIGLSHTPDYSRDGTIFLLDRSGHAVGHWYSFARTTPNPDTFFLMGGRACRYAGIFRLSGHLPVPPP